MATSPEKRAKQLRDELNHHNHLYHVHARPEISDREYDALMKELIDLEAANPDVATPDSPTQRVGGDVQSALKPVKHAVPMMSIDNTYSEEEVRAFDTRVRKALDGQSPKYVLEPKIDGASVSLRYEDGQLVLAATRGRGNTGDDITVNARTIRSIPLVLKSEGKVKPPAILEVRGEVYMDNDDFQRVNKELVAEGEEPYANPRNLTAGTLRRLDPKVVAKRRLSFLAHGLGQVEPLPVESYWEWMQLLRTWGFPLPKEVSQAETIEEVIKQIDAFALVRPTLPYMTDGVVVKIDNFAQRDSLGATSKSPKWIIAYKYETEQQPTELKEIRWQVGKGGSLTPVGDLEPVFIGGVTVTHVTLHNIDQIRKLDIHLGDTVVVERAGEVIPYVCRVIAEKRPKNALAVMPPKKCPSCSTAVIRIPDTPQIRCPNLDCPAQVRERLLWFAGRSQMDIDGLGEKLIDQLITTAGLKDFSDLYRLQVEQIANLVREVQIGETKAQEIVDSIDALRPHWAEVTRGVEKDIDKGLVDRIRFLAKKHSIKGLGERTIEQIIEAKLINTVDDLLDLKVDQIAGLTHLAKVGPKAAEKLVENIETSKSKGLARVLSGLGVRLVGTTVSNSYSNWAGNIEKLLSASMEELAEVLSKNPDAHREGERKEREYAAILFESIHDAEKSLFEQTGSSATNHNETVTEKFLTKRDQILPRGSKFGVGRIRRLVECFPDFQELESAAIEEIVDCLLEGRAVARSFYDFLHSARGKKTIEDLRSVGVRMTADSVKIEQSEWTGKTVVITGSFEGISREKLKERLVSLGAKVGDSVSSKTNAVFVGSDPGSKHDKAVSLKIAIYGEDDVKRIMGN